MTAPEGRGPGVVIPPPALYLTGFLIGLAIHRLAPGDAFPSRYSTALQTAGWAAVLGGIGLALAAIRAFRRAKTTVSPHRPAAALIASGPFRFTRNPLYLALTLVYVGAALIVGRAWPLALLPVVIGVLQWAVIRREEAYLSERFGADYDAYRRRVPRWLGRIGA